MSSRIEQLIDEIEDYIDNCKPHAFNNNKIIVNKEEIDELLRDLRMKTPDEIKRYQKIISNKEAILNDAREKAEALINEATVHTSELINEQEIMRQAYAQAQEIVELASKQAQEILDNATMEANQVRAAAIQYTDDMLASVENIISHSMDISAAKYENLLNSLTDCYNIVTANRAELYPVEAMAEEEASEPVSEGQSKEGLDII
ncbi:MAG: vacuolar family H+-ATPase subunit H [Lachnospiraceae bacterium]|nr:vacuolar family H+-ATPase subunit H [Lachnospiraceae bacterium]